MTRIYGAEAAGGIADCTHLAGGSVRWHTQKMMAAAPTARTYELVAAIADRLALETDETVATGAAVQAAAVASGAALESICRHWALGSGTEVAPSRDAADVRIRYAAAAGTYASR